MINTTLNQEMKAVLNQYPGLISYKRLGKNNCPWVHYITQFGKKNATFLSPRVVAQWVATLVEKIKQPKKMAKSQKFQVKTGSESHTTEWRSAMVAVNGKPIYEALKPTTKEWELVGNKGRHGKWCVAEYSIPVGAKVTFTAKANGAPPITMSFVVGEEGSENIDIDGYSYNTDTCGWIVSVGS
jgi:hypothetical protein